MIEKIKDKYCVYYFHKANIYKKKQKYKKSLKCLYKVKKNLSTNKDEELKLVLLNNIGDCYYHLKQYPKALETFLKAEKSSHIQDNHNLHILNQNIALCFKKMRNLSKSIEYIDKCLENEKDEMKQATLFIDLSQSYRILENYDLALTYSQKALKTYRKYLPYYSYEIGNSYLTSALVYIETESYKEAINDLEKTQEIFEEIGTTKNELKHLYELLEYVFFQIGYKDTAVFYSGKYKQFIKN